MMNPEIPEKQQAAGICKYIPNSLTLCNSLCGFLAILWMLRAYDPNKDMRITFSISAFIILFAMVFDALDGFAARLFHATSMHGLQMDSLSDMVTFGVAPATLTAVMTHSLLLQRNPDVTYWQQLLVYALSAVYLGCAALRLATYNVHAIFEKKSSTGFHGLPSPGAAAAVCILVIYARNCCFDLPWLALWLPVYAAVLGLLMVSPIPYLHVGKWLVSVPKSRRKLALLACILAFIGFFRIPGLAFIFTLYILSGPVTWICILFRRKKAEGK